MSRATLRYAFIPARRDERQEWSTYDYACEINDAIDTGHNATALALLAEMERRMDELVGQ